MNEASLKHTLKLAILREMPNVVVIRHEDQMSGGIPDLSLTMRGADPTRSCRVVWTEVKYQRPGRRVTETPLQRVMLMKLNGALVTYALDSKGRRSVTILWFDMYGQRGSQGETFATAEARLWTKHHEYIARALKARLEAR